MQSALSKRSNSVDLPPGGEACARASRRTPLIVPALLLAATLCGAGPAAAQLIDDTFTYQGRLKLDGQSVNGPADLTFYLYDAPTGGNVVGNPLTLPATAVTEGLFTVELNFDAPDFSGEARWLQVAARYPAGGPGSYTDLTPRQSLRSAPYAWHAVEAENGGELTVDLGTPGVMWTRSPNGTDVFISNVLAGIGFSSPTARLHVRAPLGFPAETARFEDVLARSQLRLATPESAGRAELQAWNGQTNTAGPLVFNVGGGNVGIGNTTPVNRLDVEGGLAVGATFAGTSAAPANGLIVEGRMGLGTATPHGNFQLQAVGGAGVWRGAIAATGTTNATVAGEWNGKATIGGHNAALNQWADLAINPHPTNGNVGIGTTTPTSRLDVAGSFEADAFKLNGNGAALGNVMISDANGGATWAPPPAATQWTTNGTHIGYMGAGNVGIGTTSPNLTLDVLNNGMIGTSSTSVNQHDVSNRGTKASFGYQVPGTAEFVGLRSVVAPGTSGCGNTGDIRFDTWECGNSISREVMRITGGGEVGMGTATPVSRLDVAGTVTADELAISSTNYTAALVESTNIGGTWLNLRNSSSLGRYWKLISTGEGNGEGAGKLLIGQGISAAGLDVNAMTIVANGNIGIGTATPAAKLDVNGTARVHVLTITGGADVAEPFNINSDGATERRSDEGENSKLETRNSKLSVEPGMVVSIDPDQIGELRLSGKAYDRTVAGIISGANGVNPGMVLTQTGSVADGKHPVALTGRVWAWCDADAGGPITAGDMLTTSDTPGHAMRVSDHDKANGAVIGKAMSPLKSGKGMVLVLVNLQ